MKKLVILGGGESGTGAAFLALNQGYKVFLSDSGTLQEKYRTMLHDWGVSYEEGGHTDRITDADEVIKSPGIPNSTPLIQKFIQQGIPVIAEVEFARRFTNAHITAITGSNGKTTTTLLLYHMLSKAGLNVGLGGNVGKSFAYQVASETFDHYVLEVSSFQLDDMYKFRANTAVLTNITPDHLDRYEYDMRLYSASKFRIIRNQLPGDAFIFCADDPETRAGLDRYPTPARHYPFSLAQETGQGAFTQNEQLIINTPPNLPLNMSIYDLALQGKHNLYNTMAAGLAAKLLGLKNESLRVSMGDFQNIEHRLEHVAKVQGIAFINDSKATNVNSVWYALESMHTPVVWIVGGVDKGNDYSMLSALVKEKVKAIVCLGKDNHRIHEAFEDMVDIIVNTHSATEAVTVAYHLGKKGDTVLLSPACSSFDLFKNYEDRGNQFKAAVKEL